MSKKPHELEIPCLSNRQKVDIVEASEQTALRFCAPVFMVGSALDSEYPNDIDIFIGLEGDAYIRLFCNYNRLSESDNDHFKNMKEMKIQQAKIYKKQKQYFESRVKGWDFDIKFQNIEQFMQHKDKKLRLDYVYSEVW